MTNQIQYTEALKLFYKSLQIDSTNQKIINNTRNLIDKLYFLEESQNSFGVVVNRDQNGNIVTYSKIHQVILQPPLGYMLFKNEGSSKEITIDDKKHQILQFNGTIPIDRNMFVGTTDLVLIFNNTYIKVGELAYHGFIATVGSTIEYDVVILDPQY